MRHAVNPEEALLVQRMVTAVFLVAVTPVLREAFAPTLQAQLIKKFSLAALSSLPPGPAQAGNASVTDRTPGIA